MDQVVLDKWCDLWHVSCLGFSGPSLVPDLGWINQGFQASFLFQIEKERLNEHSLSYLHLILSKE